MKIRSLFLIWLILFFYFSLSIQKHVARPVKFLWNTVFAISEAMVKLYVSHRRIYSSRTIRLELAEHWTGLGADSISHKKSCRNFSLSLFESSNCSEIWQASLQHWLFFCFFLKAVRAFQHPIIWVWVFAISFNMTFSEISKQDLGSNILN